MAQDNLKGKYSAYWGRDEKLIQLISKELSTFKFNVQRSLGHLAGIDTK